MFYTWIICFLDLKKMILLSVQIVMRSKKLYSIYFIPTQSNNYGGNWDNTCHNQFRSILHFTPQSVIVVIFDNNQHLLVINHLLLIFKFYIYSARNTRQLNFDNLKKIIKKVKELGKELTEPNKMKLLKTRFQQILGTPGMWSMSWKGLGFVNFFEKSQKSPGILQRICPMDYIRFSSIFSLFIYLFLELKY